MTQILFLIRDDFLIENLLLSFICLMGLSISDYFFQPYYKEVRSMNYNYQISVRFNLKPLYKDYAFQGKVLLANIMKVFAIGTKQLPLNYFLCSCNLYYKEEQHYLLIFLNVIHYNKHQIKQFLNTMTHQELQVAPGVYITDFRKEGTLVGISQPKKQLTKDVGLLLDDCETIQSKCKMLQYSNQQIEKQQNWQSDSDFVEAIEDNLKVIIRLSGQMKEKILNLFQLKYHPSSSKIQELLNVDRIDTREARARLELQKFKSEQKQETNMIEQQQDNGVYL